MLCSGDFPFQVLQVTAFPFGLGDAELLNMKTYCLQFAAFFSLIIDLSVFWQYIFQFTSIYLNTLVHSSPHLPVYCIGRWVRLHCFFFSNGHIRYDTTF
jgi:hypothetical protein